MERVIGSTLCRHSNRGSYHIRFYRAFQRLETGTSLPCLRKRTRKRCGAGRSGSNDISRARPRRHVCREGRWVMERPDRQTPEMDFGTAMDRKGLECRQCCPGVGLHRGGRHQPLRAERVDRPAAFPCRDLCRNGPGVVEGGPRREHHRRKPAGVLCGSHRNRRLVSERLGMVGVLSARILVCSVVAVVSKAADPCGLTTQCSRRRTLACEVMSAGRGTRSG